jgi:hypothetical protein
MASISLKYKSKSGNLTAPGDVDPGAMIPIATASLSGLNTITFSSIPQNYEHLQLRAYLNNAVGNISVSMQFNGDTGTNYAKHILYGDGSAAGSNAVSSTASMTFHIYSGNTASIFSASVMDVLDYSNTNKNKTVRGLCGWDNNGSGSVLLGSGLWVNTSAVTSITFGAAGGTWSSGSTIALYGIKRAGA